MRVAQAFPIGVSEIIMMTDARSILNRETPAIEAVMAMTLSTDRPIASNASQIVNARSGKTFP